MELKHALQSPSDHFKTPEDVLAHPEFSNEDKLSILKQWEDEKLQESHASDENMPADEATDDDVSDLLARIRSAITDLEGK